jgi:hypothetical protein
LDGYTGSTIGRLGHEQKHDAHVEVLRKLADVASSELRSKLAKAAGSIPSVAASEINFSDDESPTASSLIYGSAVCPPYIVTATMTISCLVGGSENGGSLAATPVYADIREFGGDSEIFEVPVDFFADKATLHIRGDLFETAVKQARARLIERP